MKFTRSLVASLGAAVLAALMPSAAYAGGSITLSIGSGYGDPYYGMDSYSDYGRGVDYYGDYDDEYDNRGNYSDYDGGYYSGSYSDDVYVIQPDYSRQAYSYLGGRDRRTQRCSSGTTGAIVGAVVGGLLGGEIGRGGYYNERSTTGAIIGAGGGALAGRAIERNGCR
jgi:hypothetical protein